MSINNEHPQLVNVRVSEFTRRISRMPVSRQMEERQKFRQRLGDEKKAVELTLNQLKAERTRALSDILHKRLPKSISIEKTQGISADYADKMAPHVQRIRDIDAELHDLKTMGEGLQVKFKEESQREPMAPILRDILDELRDIKRVLAELHVAGETR
jgi:hypothetical protein